MRNMVIYYMEALLKHITSQVNDGADYVKESSGKDQEPPAAIQNSEYRFVRDLVTLLIEKALTAKEKATNGGDFDKGMHMTYYDILSLVQSQADAFGIPLDELGLKDFDADVNLL
ncbi:hypothetical protein MBAV_001305 [Candidatus Magnetobacterium bavaricum]|uniref:Uncharacterized protein n=1 Tax=Candidatus Magnetobacterium bavaricum TaxID=29290 RepID=A0A0F3H0P2_9BACT|nr:hypothetical protein MBAV_001305 [Candidatus Magnetobacterium bavaricum]